MALAEVNRRLVFCVIVAVLGPSFQSGFNTGVINSPQKIIEGWIANITAERQGVTEQEVSESTITVIWSTVVAIFCVGGMIGAMCTRLVAERFGRRNGMIFTNLLVLVAAIMLGCAKPARSYEMLLIGRFFIGMYSGLNGGLCPMYLNEISPVSVRGAVGSVYQLVLTISIMISQLLSMEYVLGTEMGWPILLALTIVPAIIQTLLLPFCSESPRYLLITEGLEDETREALTWLRNTEDVEEEVQAMQAEHEVLLNQDQPTLWGMFKTPALRTPLVIACVSMMSQQFSGINAVMYYSTEIFTDASLSVTASQLATLGTGVVNVLMSAVSMVLVEMAGRRVLLFIGYSGMSATALVLTICLFYTETVQWVAYITIALVYLFVVFFSTGPGTIPWFLVSEMFTQSARSTATSIAVLVNWTCNFIIAIGFLPLQTAIGPYVFVIFFILLVLFAAYVYLRVPETKGKTTEEITELFT